MRFSAKNDIILAIMALLFSLLLLFAAGCKNDADTPENANTTSAKVDVDLTQFSQTMMIAVIDNIYAAPDTHIGKTMKMSGQYASVFYADIDRHFRYVLSLDDESCCSYGFIFEYDGDYPEHSPDEGEGIVVSGTFSRGQALDEVYYYLSVDDMVIAAQ